MRNAAGRISAICLLLVLLGAGAASGLDLGVETWVGNLGFRTDRASTDTSLPGADYFWGVSVYGSQPITDAFTVETGFYSDPVLRNTSRTVFTYNAKFLSVGIGPIFGLFNDLGTPVKSGLSASVRLEYPGVIFASLRSDSSLGGTLVQVGDYAQVLTDITVGVYLPNAICTFSMNTRSFEQKAASQDVTDRVAEYMFAAELYKKNVPYRLRLWLGYQDLSRLYTATSTTTATLGSVILGTQVEVTLAGPVILRAGLEGNVYSFGLGSLVGGDSSFLFRSYAGHEIEPGFQPRHLALPVKPSTKKGSPAGSPSFVFGGGAVYWAGFVASIFCCSRNRRTWMFPSLLSSARRRASLRCCRMPQIASSLMSRWVAMIALS